MSLSRTTKQILDDVLDLAGEVTNGNSPYEERALARLNRVYRTIISGGNIFSYHVDDVWDWAKSQHPVVIDLEPAVSLTLSFTSGDTKAFIDGTPPKSYSGYFLRITGQVGVYRVIKHSANSSEIILDTPINLPSGTYQGSFFRTDYLIAPRYHFIGDTNNTIAFTEDGGLTTLTATVPHGTYTPAALIQQIIFEMNSVSKGTLTGQHDAVSGLFTITSDGVDKTDTNEPPGEVTLSILGDSGILKGRSVLPQLGFGATSLTGALSYSSEYAPGAVSRLVTPAKFYGDGHRQNEITFLTQKDFDSQYPLSQTREGLPKHLTVIGENHLGQPIVRFSHYPGRAAKVSFDWIPVPAPLYDNDVSVPVFPEQDINVLIDGAAALILFDKNDDKHPAVFNFCKVGLEAMQKRKRSQAFRTAHDFGQILPRQDRTDRRIDLLYGYDSGIGAAPIPVEAQHAMLKVVKTFADFESSTASFTIPIRILPHNRTLFAVILKHSVPFTGGSVTKTEASIGITGEPYKFINKFDVTQAVADSAQDSVMLLFYPAADTEITVTLDVTGGNTEDLTAGVLEVYFQESLTV